MIQYHNLIRDVLASGTNKADRTGTGTISAFGKQLRFDLAKGFPLLTTKKLHFRSIVHELLWFLKGDTNIKYLTDNRVKIWNEWADENGEIGPSYGYQWRRWANGGDGEIDQIAQVIETLKTNPDDRRMIVNAWNVTEIEDCALPPCHYTMQFYSVNNKLSLMFNMRSTDVALGLPYNIASYALLLHMVAQQVNMTPCEIVYSGGDVHIYKNHIDGLVEQLTRTPRPWPILELKKAKSIDDYKYEDFVIKNYNPDPHLKFDVAV
jgi:thymidylate synthase|tara:strand:+ start:380 stop:1171 length:792 start_codon:yes stop_codon:yes gene_type:complete